MLCEPERIGGPFEHRARVVIQPADQARLDMILDAGASQVSAQRLEMLPRFGIERLEQQRGAGDDALHVRILAVENAQRIAVQAPLAVLIELPLRERRNRRSAARDRRRATAGVPSEFTSSLMRVNPSRRSSRADNRIISASMSGPSKPNASASI